VGRGFYEWLGISTRNPDALLVLAQLAAIGTNQAKQKNAKFVPQSLQYGTHAI